MEFKYKVVDLFSGIGGLSLGFRDNNSEIVWACDANSQICEILKYNLPDSMICNGNLLEMDVEEVPSFDILTASLIRRHSSIKLPEEFNYKNRYLFSPILDLVKRRQPKAILLESLTDIQTRDNGAAFEFIKEALLEQGYFIHHRVLHDVEFGNRPINHKKLYIVGFKDNLHYERFHFPKPIELSTPIKEVINLKDKKHDKYYLAEEHPDYEKLNSKVSNSDHFFELRYSNQYIHEEHLNINKPRKYIKESKILFFSLVRGNKVYIRDNYGIRRLTPRECLTLKGFDNIEIPHNLSDLKLYQLIHGSSSLSVTKRIAGEIISTLENPQKSLYKENITLGISEKKNIIEINEMEYAEQLQWNLPEFKGPRLVVAIQNADGSISLDHIQSYSGWNSDSRNIGMSNLVYGQKLFSILKDELGYIQLNDENIFHLQYIAEQNTHKVAMRMLGHIAEAIIVSRCAENKDVNRKWATIGRRGIKKSKSLDNYTAIGTGLLSTREKYKTKYNSTNPQRDIIWINKNDPLKELLQIAKDSNGGLNAGLQIKVSGFGKNYILSDLINYRYEVPVVYFGLNNDFDEIANELYSIKRGTLEIGKDFINVKAIDYDAFEELKNYFYLVKGLIENKIQPDELFTDKMLNNDIIRSSLIKSTIVEQDSTKSALIMST
ncbi:DNA (cytosine-5-)-methyltransferase [Priestia aryabhattai]|uniref:DNA (cytosine-5-)-methyltransferase n=1 Tax=Priestia aryabhattai TaxID=412384 RepID=UPI003D29CBEA